MHTELLNSHPLVRGMQEGFRTEAEARTAWDAMPNKLEFSFKYIVAVDTNETIAVVFEKCDPARYQDHLAFGEIK